ncbi:hypothetical protein TSST111916_17170 [Tsukamurella strandjordii]|uniref:hypothetical protein n=1 Tax=Tsukamurella TaxID=2060 RepID=UPI001C7D4E83|nr:hypothetical protein [Tsukamurella sp. TY48]GIZ97682.1 hypothetical protein TTY48_22940 [Tsukamurella sp. TY48]
MSGIEVQLSPCVGGLVRTWSDDGTDRLWAVPDDAWLRDTQGTGRLGRTALSESHFRESAELTDGALIVRPRLPVQTAGGLTMAAQTVELREAKRPSRGTREDFGELLARAVQHCVDTYEFLVIGPGAQGPGLAPLCLFAVLPDGADHAIVVEAEPPPEDSLLWAAFLEGDCPSATMSAPLNPETIAAVPLLMSEAIGRWGLDPWDLALTFGRR